jgi:hypothetical protein
MSNGNIKQDKLIQLLDSVPEEHIRELLYHVLTLGEEHRAASSRNYPRPELRKYIQEAENRIDNAMDPE